MFKMNLDVSAYLYKSFRQWLSCLIEMVLLLPAWVLMSVHLLPSGLSPVWLGVLPLLSLAGVLTCPRLPKLWQRLIVAVLLGGALAIAAAAQALPSQSQEGTSNSVSLVGFYASLVLLFAVYALAVLQGTTVSSRQGYMKLHWIGIGLYFASGIFFPRIPELKETVPLLTWAGIACLILTLFITNHHYLRYNTLSGDPKEHLPSGLSRHNRLFIMGIILVSLVLAIGTGRWLGQMLWKLLHTVLQWVFRSQPEPVPPEQKVQKTAPPESPFPVEHHGPTLLSRILDIAFYSIGALITLALVGFLGYYLYRNAGGMWRRTWNRLMALLRREEGREENTSYHDEEKSLFTWETAMQKWKKAGTGWLRAGRRAERLEDLRDNRERVRFLYRSLLRAEAEDGYGIKSYLTPLETAEDILLERDKRFSKKTARRMGGMKSRISKAAKDPGGAEPKPFAELYDKVRYGNEVPRDDEVRELRKRLLR
ncbi:hypothetical protein ACFQ3W_04625 [Paenibacillus puldeungensis]|uniref:DUF4129 domain-containing protein n=1 Tax=Paenibacillus puldeungensis TaxID=696536 RepID=A0ABW3RSX5_9BACL